MGARMGRPPSQKTILQRAALAAFTGNDLPDAPKGGKRGKVTGRYNSAGNGPRMSAWNPPTQGPNRALEGLQKIRNRARDVVRNDWSGESAIQKWTTSLIGIGITPRFKRLKNMTRKRHVVDMWNDFVEKSDADGVLNLYGQQTLVTRSWLDAGEVFARKRPRFNDEGLPVPMQVQIIEAEFVPLLDTDSRKGLADGNRIRSGIELDKRGRRVAFWVYKEHPGDNPTNTIGENDLVRVAASQMCHIFEPKRPGQLRGVPALAAVLTRLKNIEDYDDATLTRQQIANLFVGFMTRTLPELGIDDDGDKDALTGQQGEGTAAAPLLGLRPGLLQELAEGEDIKWSNPPEAGTNYPDYMRTQHMGTSAASGIPYELFSGDIKEVSDRTLRVVINEFRRFNEQRQWQIIIPMFCQRVVDWFAEAAVIGGLIAESEYDDVRRVEHSPHGWAHIHPVQDPTGKKVEVDAGFISRSSVVGARGDDVDVTDEERQSDDAREQNMKIGPYSKANAPEPVVPPAPPAPAPKPAVSALEIAQQERAEAERRLVDAQTAHLYEPAAPTALEIAQIERLKAETAMFNAQTAELTRLKVD